MQIHAMPHRARIITAEEFAKIPDDDYRYELVEGRVVRASPPGSLHGALAVQLASLLERHVRSHDLGAVMGEAGFKLASKPDTVRGPDLSFICRERIPATGLPEGFWLGAPDLAVEIRSPSDSRTEILGKVNDYLTHGARLVWVVDAHNKSVTVYRPISTPVTLGADDVLNGGDVLPGFLCGVREIFD
jgi:Uma2 family endonuclease